MFTDADAPDRRAKQAWGGFSVGKEARKNVFGLHIVGIDREELEVGTSSEIGCECVRNCLPVGHRGDPALQIGRRERDRRLHEPVDGNVLSDPVGKREQRTAQAQLGSGGSRIVEGGGNPDLSGGSGIARKIAGCLDEERAVVALPGELWGRLAGNGRGRDWSHPLCGRIAERRPHADIMQIGGRIVAVGDGGRSVRIGVEIVIGIEAYRRGITVGVIGVIHVWQITE